MRRRSPGQRPECSAVPAGDRGQRPGLARLDCALLERRLGHHRLPRVPGNRAQPDRRAHPRSRRGDELPRHRAHERADLLLQGHRPERDRRERGLERGECDAERSGHRPECSAVPAGDRGQRPGLARLDCALLERRLGHHRLPRVPGNRAQPDRRAHPRSRRGDELPRHRAHERADLLLQGHRPERDRRERGLERGECDAERSGHRPECSAVACRRPRATPRSRSLDCALLERRLGHHRLPRVPGNRAQPDRRAHPRSRRGDELPRHRAHERADLLLQGHRPERDRRERGLERGECDAERSGHRPECSAVPAGDRGQRPGLARLDCALLERRLGHHRLPRVPGNRAQPDRRAHPRSRRGDELPRHRAHERADLLLQGHRPERDRRERGLERGECDAERPRATDRAAVDPRHLQPANENPLSFASAGGTASSEAPSGASRSCRTNARAIGRRPRPLGGRRSSAPDSEVYATIVRRCPATATRSVSTCACRRRDRRRSTGTCSSSRRRAGPTR